MLKILQPRLQQHVNHELSHVQADLEKTEEPEIKFPTSVGSSKKQESSRKTNKQTTKKNIYFCLIDCTKAFDSVGHRKLENS